MCRTRRSVVARGQQSFRRSPRLHRWRRRRRQQRSWETRQRVWRSQARICAAPWGGGARGGSARPLCADAAKHGAQRWRRCAHRWGFVPQAGARRYGVLESCAPSRGIAPPRAQGAARARRGSPRRPYSCTYLRADLSVCSSILFPQHPLWAACATRSALCSSCAPRPRLPTDPSADRSVPAVPTDRSLLLAAHRSRRAGCLCRELTSGGKCCS